MRWDELYHALFHFLFWKVGWDFLGGGDFEGCIGLIDWWVWSIDSDALLMISLFSGGTVGLDGKGGLAVWKISNK